MQRVLVVLSSLLVVLSLSGCLLVAGEQSSNDSTTDGGNVYVSFVSADGSDIRTITTSFPNQPVTVFVTARVESGQLRLELLNPDNSVVEAVDAQGNEMAGRAIVTTGATGELRYRVRASGAQNGEFQILYQPGG